MDNVAEHVIRKCGGHLVVAEWCGVAASTVYKWTYPVERKGTGGLVPARYQSLLLEKAKVSGVRLYATDFFPDKRRKPVVKQKRGAGK